MKQCLRCQRKFENKSLFCPYDGQRLVYIRTDHDLIGRLIDNKYQIEEIIAKGGAGAVYRAKHIQLNANVAVKVMHGNSTTSDVTTIERFRREAFAAMQIRHPNAIAVMDFGVTSENLVYVVMEYLQGKTLREKLKEKGYLSISEANEIVQQICAACAISHRRKIVHRDLKPENIYLHLEDGQEVVKVLDFGIAKFKSSINNEGDGKITRQGFVVGTPHYMSPEQCYGKEVDARSDIYSLGIILYELLTGVVPFSGPSHTVIAVKQASERPRPTYEVRKGIPAVVNAVVMHALEKNPNNRPPDMSSFGNELDAAVKAVTEQEFLKVFGNASEQDLEAALLLASDPVKRHSSDSGTTHVEQQVNRVATALSEQETTSVEEVAATGVSLYATGSIHRSQVDKDQLLNASKEAAMLMQIIIGDLETENPLDYLFLNELRAALSNLQDMLETISRLEAPPEK